MADRLPGRAKKHGILVAPTIHMTAMVHLLREQSFKCKFIVAYLRPIVQYPLGLAVFQRF